MLNKTGLILKIEDNIAYVISKDCMYFQIKRKSGMLKGQTVEFNQSDIVYNRRFFARHYRLTAAAAVLIMVISIILYINSGLSTKKGIYAFIDIDINPSIEITIDKDRHIQDIYPLNNDAKTLIAGLDLKEVSMEDGLSKIIDRSKELGFLNAREKDVVLISAALNGNKEDVKDLIMDIRSGVNQLEDKNIKTQVIDVPQKTRELALENNISMGRYVLYEKARESGLNLSIEAVKAIPLENILNQVNINETKVNNTMAPMQTPQPDSQVSPQGDDRKVYPTKTYNLLPKKGNDSAPVFTSKPVSVQEHVPKYTQQCFATLTPTNTPSKAVQADTGKNSPDSLNTVSTPAPTSTPTSTATAIATLLPTGTPLPQGSISMSFNTTEIHAIGQIICATLEANNIRKLSGFQANLQYDPQILQPVNLEGKAYTNQTRPENGTLLQNLNYMPVGVSFNDISNGRLNFSKSYSYLIGYRNEGPEEYTGSLAIIRFKVLQMKGTNVFFQNTNNSLKEKSGIILFDWDGGSISNFEVIQPGPLVVNPGNNPSIPAVSSKSPDYTTVPAGLTWTPNPTNTSLQTPTSTDTGMQTPKSTDTGLQTPTIVATSTATPTIEKLLKSLDINSDGLINIEDALPIDDAFNSVKGEPNYNPNADLNDDNVVNMSDRMLLCKYFYEHNMPVPTMPNLEVTPVPTAAAEIKSLDINQDGSIDLKDMETLDKSFNALPGDQNFNPAADLNSDNFVNMSDRILLMEYLSNNNTPVPTMPDIYVTPGPTTTSTATIMKSFDINGDGYVNMEDLILIDQAFNSIAGDANYNPDCDFNSDNVVNMSDKMNFFNYLNEHQTSVPATSDTPCPTNTVHAPMPEPTWTPMPTSTGL
jgi:hypothetical protein